MTPLLLVALSVGCSDDCGGSYLYQPAYCIDFVPRLPARPYVPQPGDIMLATDHGIFWTWAHRLGITGHPHHSGVVFQKPDGSMAILEAGPYGTWRNHILDAMTHLRGYELRGVWIRQRKVPLTPEQSACLTAFCMRQDGKFFAIARLAGQWTPFRSRGPIRTQWMGGPHGDRRHYFCSELATEALVAAGLLDTGKTRPAATYPRDLFMDYSINPFINRNFDLSECWYPPARWISNPDCDRTVRPMIAGRARPPYSREREGFREEFGGR
jgi:hypothetical protein